MRTRRLAEFLASPDTLRIYDRDELVYTSRERGIAPLVTYARRGGPSPGGVSVYDRVIGNAAALLLGRIGCREVFSPLASAAAVVTLQELGIAGYFAEIVPAIRNRAGDGPCPMEAMSRGKSVAEFYRVCLDLRLGEGGQVSAHLGDSPGGG